MVLFFGFGAGVGVADIVKDAAVFGQYAVMVLFFAGIVTNRCGWRPLGVLRGAIGLRLKGVLSHLLLECFGWWLSIVYRCAVIYHNKSRWRPKS